MKPKETQPSVAFHYSGETRSVPLIDLVEGIQAFLRGKSLETS